MLVKRFFDILCSGIGLILLSPFFLVIALIIKISSPGEVFFRQTRVGLNQQLFRIHKFRTMITDAEKAGMKITVGRDPRITRIGGLLRKTKLDELPQLIDVFVGSMSLVGPRPEVPEYVKYYPEEVANVVFSVRPGITDWASIKMIDENAILAKSANPERAYIDKVLPEKLGYAVKYVKTRNLFLDISLIFLTIFKIFTR